jgi:hypothetical protein
VAAKHLKNDYITIKESHTEGDICIVLLDHPSEEDLDDKVYLAGANFNILQNVERMDQEQLPIPIATSPPRLTSPTSENEVQIWDDRDASAARRYCHRFSPWCAYGTRQTPSDNHPQGTNPHSQGIASVQILEPSPPFIPLNQEIQITRLVHSLI